MSAGRAGRLMNHTHTHTARNKKREYILVMPTFLMEQGEGTKEPSDSVPAAK